VVATALVGDSSVGVAVNPTANRIYVANHNNNTVSVIEDLPTVPTTLTAGSTEDVPLQGSVCNPVATTYLDNTPIATVAAAVTPSGVLESLWEFEGGVWMGWSAAFPEASNLAEEDFLDVVFICVGGSGPGAGTFTRPVP